jgi:SpoVK/Ycf46/Vps4 family AAA+-type ATPase
MRYLPVLYSLPHFAHLNASVDGAMNGNGRVDRSVPTVNNGLHIAISIAARVAPCILYISRIDEELSLSSSGGGSSGSQLSREMESSILLDMIKSYLPSNVKLVMSCCSSKASLLSPQWEKFFAHQIDACDEDFFSSMQEEEAGVLNIQQKKKVQPLNPQHKIPTVKWSDIGGLATARAEIYEVIELPLRNPALFSAASSKRCGILLYGPPGTGKTLTAKAVASECGLPFLSIKGPELLDGYVGESERNVREVFAKARALAKEARGESGNGKAGCILFFDEIDSLAPKRGGSGDGGGVMDRVVSSFLSCIDDINTGDETVFVLGATNRLDMIDDALSRPGRMERTVYLGLSESREEKMSILRAVTKKFPFESEALVIKNNNTNNSNSSNSGVPFNFKGKSEEEKCQDEKELQAKILGQVVDTMLIGGVSGAEISSFANRAMERAVRRKIADIEQLATDLGKTVEMFLESCSRGDDDDKNGSSNDSSSNTDATQLKPRVRLSDFAPIKKLF